MPISTRDFDKLTEDLQDIFQEVSGNAIADMVGFKIFDVAETALLDYKHQILHGLSGIEEVPEGADLPAVRTEEGDDITYTQRYFGARPIVTKKMRKFDRYAEIENVVRSIVQDAWDKVDQSLADVLIQGWETSYQDVYKKTIAALGPDAKALFNAAHTYGSTANTFSNIINDGSNNNPSFSRAAIVAAIKAGQIYKDANGIARPINYDTIVVTPSLADLAHRIVHSEQISGSANWDPNMHVKSRIKEIVTWERLETSGDGATAAGAYWFMYDSKKKNETLKCLFSERPELDAPDVVYKNKNWEYTVDYFYTTGIGFAPYVMGSKGTNA